MKQNSAACTTVGEPKVLLLDEPGVGVDPISRRELWQMVHELAGEGMLILWVPRISTKPSSAVTCY